MSGEQITNTESESKLRSNLSKEKNKKVNINVLFSKIRAEEKKEKFGSVIAFSLLATLILVTGIIISL
tara:strand:+ start:569 stop:772 length:204 start_codon:yes stop_codon:yes gene_type:complete